MPLIRGTKHRINLVYEASIPNRLAYRYSPDEIKKLQRQVEELITKRYMKESLSSCAVPVLLV